VKVVEGIRRGDFEILSPGPVLEDDVLIAKSKVSVLPRQLFVAAVEDILERSFPLMSRLSLSCGEKPHARTKLQGGFWGASAIDHIMSGECPLHTNEEFIKLFQIRLVIKDFVCNCRKCDLRIQLVVESA
jgi:hypothetical protein